MKSIRLLLIVFSIAFCTTAVMAFEYVVKAEPWLHTQPNKTTTFMAVMWGHSFMMEYETDDGYTIIQSSDDGYWYYAELDTYGEYTPSTEKVGIGDAPSGTHLRRSPARMAELEAYVDGVRQDAMLLAEEWRGAWGVPGIPEDGRIAVLLIEFNEDYRKGKKEEDDPLNDDYTYFDATYLQNMITSREIYNWSAEGGGAVNETTDGYATCGSVRDYWYDMSNGGVDIEPAVFDPVPGDEEDRILLINPPIDEGVNDDPIWLDTEMWHDEHGEFENWEPGWYRRWAPLDEILDLCVERNWLPDPNLENPIYPGFDILIVIYGGIFHWANGARLSYPGYRGRVEGQQGYISFLGAVVSETQGGGSEATGNHLIQVPLVCDEILDPFAIDLHPNHDFYEDEYMAYPMGSSGENLSTCGGIVGGFDNASRSSGNFILYLDQNIPVGNTGAYWNPRDRIKKDWYGTHIELEEDLAAYEIELPYSGTEPTYYSYKYVDSYDIEDNPIYGQFWLENRRVITGENDPYLDFNSRTVGWALWDDSFERSEGFDPTPNANNLLIWHAEDEGPQLHVQFGDGKALCSNEFWSDDLTWDERDGNYWLNGNDYFPSIDHDTELEVKEFGPGTHQNRAIQAKDYSSVDLLRADSDLDYSIMQTGFCVKEITVVDDDEDEGMITCEVYTNYYGGEISEDYTLTAANLYLGQDCVITGDGDVEILPDNERPASEVDLDSDVIVADGGHLYFHGNQEEGINYTRMIVNFNGHNIIVDRSGVIWGVLESEGDVEFRGPGGVIIRGGGGHHFIGNENVHVRFTSGEALPAPGDWAGILFEDLTEMSTLEYVDIEYAVNGIKAVDCSNYLELDNVTLTDFSSTGINLVNSSPTIDNCSASDSEPEGSLQPIGLYCYNASPTVTYSNFDNNYKGAEFIGASSVIEAGYNSFSDNANCGVYFYDAIGYLYNSTGFDNGYNHILGNTSDGLWAGGVAMPYLGNGTMAQGMNSIYNNSSYEVNNQTTTEIQAEYNWWGSSTGPGSINGSVDYNPWLLTSPGGGPGLFKSQEAEELIAGVNDDDDPFHRADSLFALGRFAEALRVYENLAEDVTSERLLRAVRQMRQCYLALERGNNWRDFIEGLIDNNRLRANLRPWIASLLAEETALNRPDDAVELVDGVLDDINQEVAAYAPLLFQMGMLQHYRQDNPRAALHTFRSFIESFEEHPLCPAAERELAACLDDPDIGDGPPPPPEEEDNKRFIPDDFVLYQPYPNPFNESVTVKYGVPEASDVIITLYDATGRVVRVLTQGQHQPGIHILQVSSATLNSGVYFCRLVASGKERTVKLACVK